MLGWAGLGWARSLLTASSQPPHSLLAASSQLPRSLFTGSSQPSHSLLTASSKLPHNLFTASPQPPHSLPTASSSPAKHAPAPQPPPPRQAADKRQKGGPSWKKGVRFLKPVHTWRCKRGRKTEAENWTPLFADPEADALKRQPGFYVSCASARWPCHVPPPPSIQRPRGRSLRNLSLRRRRQRCNHCLEPRCVRGASTPIRCVMARAS